ncbi:WD40/YVTN/BNR-like repeat-containing protein [Winogradskyella luteola]|uniref:Oxidoreductase n=1 Tax=Winogradskyella luteola TaxID=2828330 RepID=A0A9X1F765_9FLAO|nr:oxidoreductase [Winogradskyella luteola]MBV7268620.1 oxidoreductase [Winogradskyella luteola]
MKSIILCLFLTCLSSCRPKEPAKHRNISKVEIEHLIQDSLLNVRALEVEVSGTVSFATSNGSIGGNSLDIYGKENASLSYYLGHDTIKPNFRSLAITNKAGFALGIGSPALVFKISDSLKLVYKENHPKAFYDSIDFWNDQEGIAIGDPTEDCMSIIITRDGGETWNKLSCDDLPKSKEGEAAFAASDTNIAIVGNHTWVATGGKVSRILYSSDKGKTWQIFETPIVQGKETTGMYSVDFYDEKNGFAIGGDYTKPNATLANKVRTKDGGKTWQVVADGKRPGYRSCVQYVPNSNAKELVSIGFKGIDYSNNAGDTWKHLSDEGFYTIRFLNDSVAYAAGKGRVSKLTFRE